MNQPPGHHGNGPTQKERQVVQPRGKGVVEASIRTWGRDYGWRQASDLGGALSSSVIAWCCQRDRA